MAKQSRKRIRELFEEEVQNKTYFEFRFSIDGTMVKLREDAQPSDLNIYVDEDGDYYPEDQTIVFQFDAKVKRQLSKTFRRLLKLRKVAPLDSVTVTHPEVREAIKAFAGSGKVKDVDFNTQERIKNEVVSKYEPEYELALYETVLLVMVERDLFLPSKLKRGGISVDTKIEVEISEDFWITQSPVQEEDNEFDALYDELKFGNYIEDLGIVVRDKTAPLEFMIATVDTLILENEGLADIASDLAKVVVANVFVSANREAVVEDGLEPFRERLEALLPEFMGRGNNSVQWKQSSGGVPVVFGTVGDESDGEEGDDAFTRGIEYVGNGSRTKSKVESELQSD